MFRAATGIFLIGAFFFFFSGVIATDEDKQCLSACSDWSVVLGYCRGQYKETSEWQIRNMEGQGMMMKEERRWPFCAAVQQFNLTYMNDFIGCLCEGQTYAGTLGNETITGSAGICESCQTTPALIQENLQVDNRYFCSLPSLAAHCLISQHRTFSDYAQSNRQMVHLSMLLSFDLRGMRRRRIHRRMRWLEKVSRLWQRRHCYVGWAHSWWHSSLASRLYRWWKGPKQLMNNEKDIDSIWR